MLSSPAFVTVAVDEAGLCCSGLGHVVFVHQWYTDIEMAAVLCLGLYRAKCSLADRARAPELHRR